MRDLPKPGNPSTVQSIEDKFRRDLHLIAVVGLLSPCVLCWASMRLETFETVLIPLVQGFLVLLYTLYAFYQREGGKDRATRLWREVLAFLGLAGITALGIAWLIHSAGWKWAAGILILGLGAWSLFLAGRRAWRSRSFNRRSVLYEVDGVELDMVSIRGSHPVYAQLVYRYAGDYRGQLRTDRIQRQMAEIQEAMEGGRFRAIVRYLPDDPPVHRLESWWIDRDRVP